MFEVHAKLQSLIIWNMELAIYSDMAEYSFDEVEFAVYTTEGGFYDLPSGNALDRSLWTERGSASVMATSSFLAEPLPPNTFPTLHVQHGTTLGIYITIKDPR
jgi:hypothetical protein